MLQKLLIMTIQYSTLKEKIYNSVSPVLESSEVGYSKEEIYDGIDLMYDVFRHSVHNMLNGLSKHIEPALEKAFISELGQIGPLGIITPRIEGFLRKIMILCLPGTTYESAARVNLVGQFKALELSERLVTENPELEEHNLDSFDNIDCLYSLCLTRLTRNTIHDAPDWRDIQVLDRRDHTLIVYVYAVLKHKDCLSKKVSNTQKQLPHDEIPQSEQAMLYDFITFSQSTTSIREKIVESYILHLIFEEGAKPTPYIKEKTDGYFSHELPLKSYKKLLRRLVSQRKVSQNDEVYELEDDEKIRIQRAKEDFAENRLSFSALFQEMLSTYGIGDKYDI